ncbi:type II toxin-antitoxin system YafQ family toxin [Acidaminococcus fermentans]|uniref:type II toxin-antitoxin system YafQ family toxin n=1 Tax=Acidaminococcus fermentans TaxID=905 RepID=UPI00243186B8|nr:type II toxin-antitoxin system YafQ family toxin [Acidaminococcus fermentans]
MYRIKFTAAYKKSYKKLKKRGLDLHLLDNVIEKLQKGIPLDPQYRDHQLTGQFAGFHECHIQPDWLLIYLIEEDILVLTLVETGSHADLFHM